MYELKKNGKVFTSKSVGTGPSSCEKKNLPGRGLTKLRNTVLNQSDIPAHACFYPKAISQPLLVHPCLYDCTVNN